MILIKLSTRLEKVAKVSDCICRPILHGRVHGKCDEMADLAVEILLPPKLLYSPEVVNYAQNTYFTQHPTEPLTT